MRFDSCAYGYINKSGKMVIEPGFFRAEEFSQGLAAVATEAGSGGASTDGDFIDIALRKYIRTMFKCSIDTIMKVVKFVPPLSHPVFEYKPPMLDLV